MTRALDTIIFDCDGTLVDSQAMIIRTMEEVFDRAGLTRPDPAAIRRVVGLSLPEAMAVLLPDLDPRDHHGLADHYKQAFGALRLAGADREEMLYPGIADVLADLDAAGYILGVATGKSARGLAHTLDRHGLASLFVTTQTADRHPSKPHPSMLQAAIMEAGGVPERTVLIGDTRYDMEMALSAGAVGLGVTWGYHPAPELRASGAKALATQAGDIPDLLGQLLA